MKSIFLFLLIFVSTFCFTQESEQGKVDVFLTSFTTAVENHNADLTIKHLNKVYVKTQLKQFLKNNKEQFLNELFSGEECSSKTWINFKFEEITSIEIAEITEENAGIYNVVFRVKNATNEAKCNLQLEKTTKKKKEKYSLTGAVG